MNEENKSSSSSSD